MGTTTLRDFTRTFDGYVERQFIRLTTSNSYPSGYRYSLHFGTLEGTTILRYDNSHEVQKGHERHTMGGVEEIEFPGMIELIERFEREIGHYIGNRHD